MSYARENLRRVQNFPEDYPNRDLIISHWKAEVSVETAQTINDEYMMVKMREKYASKKK